MMFRRRDKTKQTRIAEALTVELADQDDEIVSFVFDTPRAGDNCSKSSAVFADDDDEEEAPDFHFNQEETIVSPKTKIADDFFKSTSVVEEEATNEKEDDEYISFVIDDDEEEEEFMDIVFDEPSPKDTSKVWAVVSRSFPESLLGVAAPCKRWLAVQQSVRTSCIFDAFFAEDWSDLRGQKDFIGCAALLSLAHKFFFGDKKKKKHSLTDQYGRHFLLLDEAYDKIDHSQQYFLVVDARPYHRLKEATKIIKAKHLIIQYGYEIQRGWDLQVQEEYPCLDNTLESLWLPAAEYICDHALAYCLALQTIAAPVASRIGKGAFRFCASLLVLSLPFVSQVDDRDAFGQCARLATISLPMHTKDADSDDQSPSHFPENEAKQRWKSGLTKLLPSAKANNKMRNRFARANAPTPTAALPADSDGQSDDEYLTFDIDDDEEEELGVWDIVSREYPRDMLSIDAPCQEILRAQRKVDSAEIFDVFFESKDWTDVREHQDFVGCAALLSLVKKFFLKKAEHRVCINNRIFFLIDDEDDDYGMKEIHFDESQVIFLLIDLRQYHHRKQSAKIPPNVRHLIIQYGYEIQRSRPLYDDIQGPSKPLTDTTLETLWLPAADIIGRDAAAYCIALRVLAAPVCTKIESGAFRFCDLRIISNPFVIDIGENAFRDCKQLHHVSLPSCETITMAAFHSCYKLKSVEIPRVLHIKDEAFLDTQLEDVHISFASSIDAYAFAHCYALRTVFAPLCLKVGANAFEHCKVLQDLDSFVALTRIGHRAFRGCISLKDIKFHSVDIIGVESFCANTQLRSFSAPATLIGDRAFRACFRMIKLNLDYAEVLCQEACRDCLRLETVSLSKSIHTIGDRCFLNCVFLIDQALLPPGIKLGKDIFDDPIANLCLDYNDLTPDTPPSRPPASTERSVLAAENKKRRLLQEKEEEEKRQLAAVQEEEETPTQEMDHDKIPVDDFTMNVEIIDEDADDVDDTEQVLVHSTAVEA